MSSIYYRQTFQRAFGTFPLRGAELAKALADAVRVGYRAIDTAQMYGNEADIGAALPDLPVTREQLLITTKVHPDNFTEARFRRSVEESLAALRIGVVDVLLLHWPPVGGDVVPSLRLLQQAREAGLARYIGVSNYTAAMMRTARQVVSVPLAVNQVEFHPLLNQDRLLTAAAETGIPLSSYCSVARGEVFRHPIFAEIGADYGRTAGQIVLRWILQKGVAITTMSTNPVNIAANFDVMDFTLSSIDMARIEAMTRTSHRVVHSGLVPWAPDWD